MPELKLHVLDLKTLHNSQNYENKTNSRLTFVNIIKRIIKVFPKTSNWYGNFYTYMLYEITFCYCFDSRNKKPQNPPLIYAQ